MSLALWEFFWSTSAWAAPAGGGGTVVSTGKFMIVLTGQETRITQIQM